MNCFVISLNRQNNTQQQDQITCQPINTDTVEIWISNGCEGHWQIQHCPPLFISIEGPTTHDGLNMRCVERECRFPDSSRFTINGENLGCFSNVGKVIASFLLLALSLIVTIRF